MSERSRAQDAVLVPWLSVLCLVSAVATVQAILFPTGARVEDLQQAFLQHALSQAGLVAKPLRSRQAQHRADIALSRQLGWTLSDGSQLWLVHGSARRYRDLQAAALSSGQPELFLQQRQLDRPLHGSASGRVSGYPAVQTCLVPQLHGPPVAGITNTALLRASDPRRHVADLREPKRWPPILLGLILPRRFSCVLVTLRSDSQRPLDPQLWPRLLEALKPAVQQPGSG